MNVLFYGKDVDECLKSAEDELGIKRDSLNYKVVKKSGLFNKITTIEVKIQSNFGQDESNKKPVEKQTKKTESDDELLEILDEMESGIQVKNGRINVIAGKDDEEKFTIRACKGIDLYINDIKCEKGVVYNVTHFDDIRYIEEKANSERNIEIRISDDKMKAYAKIIYKPKYVYKLVDKDVTKNMVLKARKVETSNFHKYTVSDVVGELKNKNVMHGILFDVIHELCETGSESEVIIAQGESPLDDIPDSVKLFFEAEDKTNLENGDEKKTIDYRNLKSISNVEEGKVIAQKVPGKEGKDGIDIFGNDIKRKIVRSKPIRAGKGCKIEEGKVISTKRGRPTVQNGVFTVNTTYSVRNIDMHTGNINFAGDIEVNGTIEDGMEAVCRGTLFVRKDITSAKAKANGNIEVMKNIINSNVLAGGYDAEKSVYIDCLKSLSEEMKGLLMSIEKMSAKAPDRRISELFKILVEQRYKRIPKLALEVITYNITLGIKNSEILDFIRNKIIGINAFKVSTINELYEFQQIIKDEIECLGEQCEIPADVKAYYVQNSSVVCTGSILITGPGSYISNLRAFDTIEFTDKDAVIRGGTLTAKKHLKLRNVGSEVGIITKLKVDEGGIIEADTMLSGTVLYFGNRRKILNDSGRMVKAFVNKDKEIQIDMLKLEY